MRRLALVCIALVGALGCANTSTQEVAGADQEPAREEPAQEKPSLFEAAPFTIPVVNGYSVVTDPALTPPGGVALAADSRPKAATFTANIVVTSIPPGPDFAPADPEFCKLTASTFETQIPVTVAGTEIVETGAGEACQYRLVDNNEPTRGATGTIMYKTRDNAWIVTCNYDSRDPGAPVACAEVVAAWAFK